eukprot:686299-Pyramimonas_sp.AAC.1
MSHPTAALQGELKPALARTHQDNLFATLGWGRHPTEGPATGCSPRALAGSTPCPTRSHSTGLQASIKKTHSLLWRYMPASRPRRILLPHADGRRGLSKLP